MTEPKAEPVQVVQILAEEIVLPVRKITSARIVGILADVQMLDNEGVTQDVRRVIYNAGAGFAGVPPAVTDWIISEATKQKDKEGE